MDLPDNDKNVIIFCDNRNSEECANKKVQLVEVLNNQCSRNTETKQRAQLFRNISDGAIGIYIEYTILKEDRNKAEDAVTIETKHNVQTRR